MRKFLFLIALLFSAVVLSGCVFKKTTPTGSLPVAEPTPVPTRPIDQTIKERPYVSLLPTSDRHWVTLEIKNIPKGTKGVEYDLTYLADFEESKIERGVSTGGIPVELNGATEYSKKILFGSASCTTGTCKYKYDENVNEGSLSFNFVGGSLTEKLQTAYRIQRGKEAAVDGFTTGDGVFTLRANLLANSIYLTASSIGVPSQLPAGVIPKTAPYAVYPAVLGKAAVAFKTDLVSPTIYAFDGKSWQKLITTAAGGEAKAETSGTSVFILAQ